MPTGYRKLNWIGSNNTNNYIKIYQGLVDNNIGIKATYSHSSCNSADKYMIGNNGVGGRVFLFGINNAWAYGWGGQSTGRTTPRFSTATYPIENGNFYTASLNFLNSKKVYFQNEGGDMSASSEVFSTNNGEIYAFRFNTNNVMGKVKEIYLSYGTELIGHFVPYIRESDNVVGLYDEINNEFHTNQGTGTLEYEELPPSLNDIWVKVGNEVKRVKKVVS